MTEVKVKSQITTRFIRFTVHISFTSLQLFLIQYRKYIYIAVYLLNIFTIAVTLKILLLFPPFNLWVTKAFPTQCTFRIFMSAKVFMNFQNCLRTKFVFQNNLHTEDRPLYRSWQSNSLFKKYQKTNKQANKA